MKGIYRHRKTGAEQILSESTVAILNERDLWEFVGESIPNLEDDSKELKEEIKGQGVMVQNENPLRDITNQEPANEEDKQGFQANEGGQENGTNDKGEGILEPDQTPAIPKASPKPNEKDTAPKQAKAPKVITLEDLNK